jgi:hypothetical protein
VVVVSFFFGQKKFKGGEYENKSGGMQRLGKTINHRRTGVGVTQTGRSFG